MNHIDWQEREDQRNESLVDQLCGFLGAILFAAALISGWWLLFTLGRIVNL